MLEYRKQVPQHQSMYRLQLENQLTVVQGVERVPTTVQQVLVLALAVRQLQPGKQQMWVEEIQQVLEFQEGVQKKRLKGALQAVFLMPRLPNRNHNFFCKNFPESMAESKMDHFYLWGILPFPPAQHLRKLIMQDIANKIINNIYSPNCYRDPTLQSMDIRKESRLVQNQSKLIQTLCTLQYSHHHMGHNHNLKVKARITSGYQPQQVYGSLQMFVLDPGIINLQLV
eukprot:TRINITY_DN8787_c0_g3_i1.p2 TRINITY_DN8787_c0_g3~~TRINITY_DN8787_c0_g3_i1.p2  ORF type:complete len:227 (-),score=7.31 TRINITY_DN8787_c0_g3_i1:197-877(-)